MKKLLKSTLAVCLLFCMMFGLTACGNLPLTEENAVGNYQMTHMTYTASEDNTHGYQSCDYSKKQYEELLVRIEAGTATAKETDNDYYVIAGCFDETFDVRLDGTIYSIYEDATDFWGANWKIKDGEFVYESLMGGYDNEYSAKWENNRVVLTQTITGSDPFKGVIVYTYEKVKREEVALTAQNVVGEYNVINATYTPNADNTQYTTPYSVNRASYTYCESKVNNGTATQTEREKFDIFSFAYSTNIRLTEDGQALNDDSAQEGLWEIKNGKLDYTATADTINQYSAKWDNGRIVIIVNLIYAMGPQGLVVFTLEKIPA